MTRNRSIVLAAAALALAGAAAPASARDDFGGLWCGAGFIRGATLELSQRQREFDGVLRYRKLRRDVSGTVEGPRIRAFNDQVGELVLELRGPHLRIAQAGGTLALAVGQSFVRAPADRCD